jgi:hypothetical protein
MVCPNGDVEMRWFLFTTYHHYVYSHKKKSGPAIKKLSEGRKAISLWNIRWMRNSTSWKRWSVNIPLPSGKD